MRFLLIICVVAFAAPAFSQNYVRAEITMSEGIFQSYHDYLDRRPKETKLVKRGSNIFYLDDSAKKELRLDPEKVWGYSINNNVYISYEDGFWKLINQGKLNHFSAIVIRYYQSYDSFGFMVNRATQVMTHLFFDRDNGRVLTLEKDNFKNYFEEDPKLEKYYKKLNGNKTDKMILVLRAYNDRHPE